MDDACDPHPQVRVVSVTSNQPANGGGSGDTPVDVVHGAGAFCVRAERSASLHQDRIYSVVLQAEDASGNRSALRTVEIRVPHDQGEPSAGRCDAAGTARRVPDGDPRCSGLGESAIRIRPHGIPASGPWACCGCWRRVVGAPRPLSQCVVGWWLGSTQGCDCPSQAECAQSDCQAFAVYGFTAGGTAWQGLISVSRSAHTLSSEGAGEWDPYQVQGGSRVILGTGTNAVTLDVSCGTSRLQVGDEAFDPAPDAEAKALDTETAGGHTSFNAQTF